MTKHVMSELRVLERVRNENIVNVIDLHYDDLYYYIVTELAESGDLLTLIEERRRTKSVFCENEVRSIARQLFEALDYLHQN